MRKSLVLLTLLMTAGLLAQPASWKPPVPANRSLELFHAMHVSGLPTAETMQKNDLEFEVSHRFIPAIDQGFGAFYGLDGPANIRLALGYAISNSMFVSLGRSNVQDNFDLNIKARMLQWQHDTFPVLIGMRAGAAYNDEIFDPVKSSARQWQFYGQLIANTLIHDKLGIGVVPSYLYNANIFCCDVQYSLTMGSYLQYYASPHWSLFAEWNPTISGWRSTHDSFALGLEVETGGHFFKIILANNDRLNPSQFLAGADRDFWDGGLRLGFMITRLIKI